MNPLPTATHMTIHLVRYDAARVLPPEAQTAPVATALQWLAGADESRHGGEFFSGVATEFVGFGLHADEASARACARTPMACFADADERWSGAFRVARALKGCNWIDDHVDLQCTSSGSGGPLAVLTSAGWELGPSFVLERAMSFADAVGRVRAAATAVDVAGMHSMQLFAFPGVLVHDGVTLTFWNDEVAMKEFAYRAGTHKTELDAFRLDETTDRTSFTRLRPIESHGTWWGTDPFAGCDMISSEVV
jgi:hypothetical protein